MTALRRLAALVAAVGLPAAAPCRNYLNYGDCFHYTAIDATFHCGEFFCPGCPYSGYCDELCGFCGEYGSLLHDCHGVEAPSVFIGDGFCDDGTYLYDGKTVDFDCPAFGCDGGDCPSALARTTPPSCDRCATQKFIAYYALAVKDRTAPPPRSPSPTSRRPPARAPRGHPRWAGPSARRLRAFILSMQKRDVTRVEEQCTININLRCPRGSGRRRGPRR